MTYIINKNTGLFTLIHGEQLRQQEVMAYYADVRNTATAQAAARGQQPRRVTFDDAIHRAHIRSAHRKQRVTLAMWLWLAVCIGVVALAWIDPAGVL